MRRQLPSCFLVLLISFACLARPCLPLHFRVLQSCGEAHAEEGGEPMTGIAVEVTAAEFYASFAGIFRLTDGSRISAPAGERMESLKYMQYLLHNIHVYVNRTASEEVARNGGTADVLQICGRDVVDMMLLAVVGNFVSVPGDVSTSPQSSLETMPSVAIDAYTGQLVMRTPYDAVRGYFVEALLVLSIIAIMRLTFVRNNAYTTVVHLSSNPSAASESASAAESAKDK